MVVYGKTIYKYLISLSSMFKKAALTLLTIGCTYSIAIGKPTTELNNLSDKLSDTLSINYRIMSDLFKSGEYKICEKVFDTLKKSTPEFHIVKGYTYLNLNKNHKAIENIENCLISKPDLQTELTAKILLGRAYQNLDSKKIANDWYDNVISSVNRNIDRLSLQFITQTYYFACKHQYANNNFKKVIELVDYFNVISPKKDKSIESTSDIIRMYFNMLLLYGISSEQNVPNTNNK